MKKSHSLSQIFILLAVLLALSACGGGGGGGGGNDGIAARELLDPTPGANNFFGEKVILLGNGNVVVSDRRDSSLFENNGAVHLYSPDSSTPIASIYGDAVDDLLGITGITALPNDNYVIVSAFDDENGVVDAGTVRLMDGSTGDQIGSTLMGDVADDRLGLNGITVLPNSNYVIASSFDNENGVIGAGSVRLVDGATGQQIGSALSGDTAFDGVGNGSVTALANANYVIASRFDNENDVVNAGAVRLMDGSTGEQIGSTVAGDVENDQLGFSGITALANNNYVVASQLDDENGIVNAGTVRLMGGTTGEQVGTVLVGDEAEDRLGSEGITALANNNYVVASSADNENGIALAGSVRLVDGSTGVQIGTALTGDVAGDQLGSSSITALPNNNYVIASEFDSENGVIGAGSVRLVDGSTGTQIGDTMAGDASIDFFGSSVITALPNNNYVIASPADSENGIASSGVVRLVDGSTGEQIGAALTGDVAGDQLGSNSVNALTNNNYVVVSEFDNENGVIAAGSARLVDGNTGAQIGDTIVGIIGTDMMSAQIVQPKEGGYYILAQPFADNSGLIDAGMVRIVVP